MGVPKLFSEYFSRKKAIWNSFTKKGPIGVLAIDFNSILHKAAQYSYMYGDFEYRQVEEKNIQKITEKDSLESFRNKINELVREVYEFFKPTHYLIIATDGVPPHAKTVQQRQRRYKKQLGPESPEIQLPINKFDSNMITPGTQFMKNLDKWMKRFVDNLQEDIINTEGFPATEVLYSSSSSPGEGEHKIFHIFKKISGNIPEKHKYILYGLDADLTVISMVHPIPIYVAKERIMREGETNISYDVIDAKNLIGDLDIGGVGGFGTTAEEFVLILMFLGNDFVPTTPVFENLRASKNMLTDALSLLKKGKKLRILYDGTKKDPTIAINWELLREFVEILAELEGKYIQKVYNERNEPVKRGFDAYIPHSQIKRSANDEGIINIDDFQRRWKKNITNVTRNRDAFNILYDWAEEEIVGKPDDYKAFIEELEKEHLEKMVEEYFVSMLWTMDYYINGHGNVNKSWYYPFHWAPTFKMLFEFMPQDPPDSFIYEYTNEYLAPEENLVAVLPPVSKNLLDRTPRLANLLNPQSEYGQYFPTSFKVDGNGKRVKHMEVPIIPYVSYNIAKEMVIFSGEKINREIDRTIYSVKEIAIKLEGIRRSREFGRGSRSGRIRLDYLGDPIGNDDFSELSNVSRIGSGNVRITDFKKYNEEKQEEWRKHGRLLIP